MSVDTIAVLIGAVAGAVSGWMASDFFVVSRVKAMEEALALIDVRIDNLMRESKR